MLSIAMRFIVRSMIHVAVIIIINNNLVLLVLCVLLSIIIIIIIIMIIIIISSSTIIVNRRAGGGGVALRHGADSGAANSWNGARMSYIIRGDRTTPSQP